MSQYWDENSKSINIEKVIRDFDAGKPRMNDHTFMIIGNFYTEYNRKIITQKVNDSFLNGCNSSGMIWMTNSGSMTWGKTADLNILIDDIYNSFDKRKKTSKVVMGMVCKSYPESVALKNVFWGLSHSEIMDFPNNFGGEGAEFIIIPNVMVASLFHFQFDDHRDISFPVGYVTFQPKFVSQVSKKLLDWSLHQPDYGDFFEAKGTSEDQLIRNKYFIPILNQISG